MQLCTAAPFSPRASISISSCSQRVLSTHNLLSFYRFLSVLTVYSTFLRPWILASRAVRPRPQLTKLAMEGHS